MKPRWLRGWSWWADVRPTGADRSRPLLERLAVFIGLRRDW